MHVQLTRAKLVWRILNSSYPSSSFVRMRYCYRQSPNMHDALCAVSPLGLRVCLYTYIKNLYNLYIYIIHWLGSKCGTGLYTSHIVFLYMAFIHRDCSIIIRKGISTFRFWICLMQTSFQRRGHSELACERGLRGFTLSTSKLILSPDTRTDMRLHCRNFVEQTNMLASCVCQQNNYQNYQYRYM